jgi:CubicO group peptidase (beta-lactamase class C family)
MKYLFFIFFAAAITSCSTTVPVNQKDIEAAKEQQRALREQKNKKIDKKIEEVVEAYNIPAVHAVIYERDETSYQKVQGLRSIDAKAAVTVEDRFYLGHQSKILTSVLMAQLIDQKVINWESTLGELIGKDFNVNPQLRQITVEMLLAQRSGITAIEKLKVWPTLGKYSTRRGRELLVQSALSYNPEFTPGTRTDTNSVNYVVLGWILEKYTNFQWEELAKNKIFYDIGMNSCGFGLALNPKSEAIDQPLGHTLNQLKVVPTKSLDIPNAIAPAESLHCSAADFSKLLKEINLGLYRSSSLLQEDTYAKLFGPSGDPKLTYAHFQVHDRVWAGGRTLTASSQDGSFTSHVVLAPARELIILVMINSGTPKAREGAAKILKVLTESVQ